MMSKQFPRLHYFFGSYLHQDFCLEYGDWSNACDSFASSEDINDVIETAAELDAFISLDLPVSKLKDILLREFICYVDAESLGLSYYDWLRQVRQRIQKAIERGVG